MAAFIIPPQAFASFEIDMSAPNKSGKNHQSHVSGLRRFRLEFEQLSKYMFVQWPLEHLLVDQHRRRAFIPSSTEPVKISLIVSRKQILLTHIVSPNMDPGQARFLDIVGAEWAYILS